MLSTAPIRAYIPASDVARARKFYENTVGLTPKEEYAGGVIYGNAGHRGVYVPHEQRGDLQGQPGVLAGRQRRSGGRRIKARVVVVEENEGIAMRNSISTGGGAKTARFRDTEGNILAISESL